MKKRVLVLLLCGALLCGCSSRLGKYQRINFESDYRNELLGCIRDDTVVTNNTNETFPTQLPIYKIKERIISEETAQEMCRNLGFEGSRFSRYKVDGNYLDISLTSYTNVDRGYFEMTAEEGEALAWELFRKIPFIEGEYECAGIGHTITISDHEGSHITRAGFQFRRALDGVRVTGADECMLYLDGSGLVGVSIRLYDYEKIGTMDLVSLQDASARLKIPDDFDFERSGFEPSGMIEELRFDQVKLLLVNQHHQGCEILQPIYYYTGTAVLGDGKTEDFSSKIIAIPDTYTYETEAE